MEKTKKKPKNLSEYEKKIITKIILYSLEKMENEQKEREFKALLKLFSKNDGANKFFEIINANKKLYENDLLDTDEFKENIVFNSSAMIGSTITKEFDKTIRKVFTG